MPPAALELIATQLKFNVQRASLLNPSLESQHQVLSTKRSESQLGSKRQNE